MIDGNLAMANHIVNETEEQNSFAGDVINLARELECDFKRFPLPIEFCQHEELKQLNLRKQRIVEIARRYMRIQYTKSKKAN